MYNIETLSKLSGLNRRTIRYYIQRELLPPPEGSGRGSYYTDEHLSRLKNISKWSEQGMPLFQMKAILDGTESKTEAKMKFSFATTYSLKELYQHIVIDEDLMLVVKDGKFSQSQILNIEKSIKKIIQKGSL